ncbi:MAG: hypothetical protein WBZ32_00600, partial [Candidatus Acidiferrales bacterium]
MFFDLRNSTEGGATTMKAEPSRIGITRFRRELGSGSAIPLGWRMAWYEPRARTGIYYPAPAHIIARWLREISYRIRLAIGSRSIEHAELLEMQRANRERQQLADEYARGYMAGWRECFETCLTAVEEELSQGDDVWALGS